MLYKKIPIQVENSAKDTALYVYILDSSEIYQKGLIRPMIIVCPGGGYERTSDREAEPIAMRLLGMGYHVGVLRYSVAPKRFPTALTELAESMKIIREHADKWNVNSQKIYVMGASAGGHLAASLGVFWNEKFLCDAVSVQSEMIRPNGMILCYPVISSQTEYMHKGSFRNLLGEQYLEKKERVSLERFVTEQTPPCFLWHTFTDPAVPVENSLLFAKALCDAGVSVELHIYPTGGHGLSLADETTTERDGKQYCEQVQSWVELLKIWLRTK